MTPGISLVYCCSEVAKRKRYSTTTAISETNTVIPTILLNFVRSIINRQQQVFSFYTSLDTFSAHERHDVVIS